jgi:hypothetical protein
MYEDNVERRGSHLDPSEASHLSMGVRRTSSADDLVQIQIGTPSSLGITPSDIDLDNTVPLAKKNKGGQKPKPAGSPDSARRTRDSVL